MEDGIKKIITAAFVVIFVIVLLSVKSCTTKKAEEENLARMLEEQVVLENEDASIAKMMADVEKTLIKTNYSLKKDFLALVAYISFGAKTDEMLYKLDDAMSQSIREEQKTKYEAYVIKEYTKELKESQDTILESLGKTNHQKKNQIVKQIHAFDMNGYKCTTLIAEYRQVIKALMKADKSNTYIKLQLKKAEDAIENLSEAKASIRNLHSEILSITKEMN